MYRLMMEPVLSLSSFITDEGEIKYGYVNNEVYPCTSVNKANELKHVARGKHLESQPRLSLNITTFLCQWFYSFLCMIQRDSFWVVALSVEKCFSRSKPVLRVRSRFISAASHQRSMSVVKGSRSPKVSGKESLRKSRGISRMDDYLSPNGSTCKTVGNSRENSQTIVVRNDFALIAPLISTVSKDAALNQP